MHSATIRKNKQIETNLFDFLLSKMEFRYDTIFGRTESVTVKKWLPQLCVLIHESQSIAATQISILFLVFRWFTTMTSPGNGVR